MFEFEFGFMFEFEFGFMFEFEFGFGFTSERHCSSDSVEGSATLTTTLPANVQSNQVKPSQA